MQRNFNIGNLIDNRLIVIGEISIQTTQNSLMSNYNNRNIGTLNLKNNRLNTRNQIQVGFPSRISEPKFVLLSLHMNYRVILFDFFVSHPITYKILNFFNFTNPRSNFIQRPHSFRFYSQLNKTSCRISPLQSTSQKLQSVLLLIAELRLHKLVQLCSVLVTLLR